MSVVSCAFLSCSWLLEVLGHPLAWPILEPLASSVVLLVLLVRLLDPSLPSRGAERRLTFPVTWEKARNWFLFNPLDHGDDLA